MIAVICHTGHGRMKTQKIHIYTTGSSYRLDDEITDFLLHSHHGQTNFQLHCYRDGGRKLEKQKITMLAFKFNLCFCVLPPFLVNKLQVKIGVMLTCN